VPAAIALPELTDLERDILEPDEVAAGVRLVLDDDGTLRVEDGFVRIDSETGTVYRWRCAICGYIHEAPAPPRWCPLCGADQDQFEALAGTQS
jgi:rubrerythrin